MSITSTRQLIVWTALLLSCDGLALGSGIIYSLEFAGSPNVITGTPLTLDIKASFSQPLVAAAFRISVSGSAGATLTNRTANPLEPNGLSYISTTQQNPYAANLPINLKSSSSMEVLLDLNNLPPNADGLTPDSNVLIERITILPSGTGSLTLSLTQASGATTLGAADGTLLEPVSYGRSNIVFNVVSQPVCNHPPFDVDGDHDVDQVDFGALQACITGSGDVGLVFNPNPCNCFDVNHDNDLDQGDIDAFELCVSGPSILAVPTCGD